MSRVTLKGSFTRFDGAPATGTVKIISSRSPITDPDNQVIISGPQTFPLDEDGKIEVSLPATDDPSMGEAWTYDIIANMSHSNWQIRGLTLPSSMTTVDLSNPPSGVVKEYPTRQEWDAITAGMNTTIEGKVDGPGMGLRLDNSVGTRVLLDHPGGTTMLYGDTGWRTLTSWDSAGVVTGTPLGSGFSPTPDTSGAIRIRRKNDMVTLEMWGLTKNAGAHAILLPAGFALSLTGVRTSTQWQDEGPLIASGPANLLAIYIASTGTARTAHDAASRIQWRTASAWPTTLPGLPG